MITNGGDKIRVVKMTKKFLHTDSKSSKMKIKNEHIIPDIFENKSRLIGIESEKVYTPSTSLAEDVEGVF